mgnify:CR=1 FL=1
MIQQTLAAARTYCVLLTTLLAALPALPAAAEPATDCQAEQRLEAVLASPHRSEANRARDVYRHPAATLRFFDVEPQMSVVEIWPGGGGWYTEVLAPYLKGCGKYFAASFDPDSEVPFYRLNAEKFAQKLAADPEHYSEVKLMVLQPPDQMVIAAPGSVDRVLTFRNVHNWMKAGHAEKVFAAMYRALKPGGILGVVEHRAAPDTVQDIRAESGYVSEAHVLQLATQAGFKLMDRSEINDNPKDDREHPAGVWTLPPSLRLGDEGREYYLAIGESDRMTLKFIK